MPFENDRAFDNDVSQLTAVVSTRMEATIESGTGGGWISYLGAGGWSALFSELANSVADLDRSTDGPAANDLERASVIDGKTPVAMLVSLLDAPGKLGSSGVEEIAELSPTGESSSLALAATLWAAPSDPRIISPGCDRPVEGRRDGVDRAASLSSLREFVIGLDLALEESCRNTRAELLPSALHGSLGPHSGAAGLDPLEWNGSIVPGPRAIKNVTPDFPRTGGSARSATSTPSLEAESLPGSRASAPSNDPRVESAQLDAAINQRAHGRFFSAEDAVTALAAAAAATMLAGWSWTKRWRRPRSSRAAPELRSR